MKTFIETIKIKDGRFYNLNLHLERMNRTTEHFFKSPILLPVHDKDIPYEMRSGLIKCRVSYSKDIIGIEFEKYQLRKIESLKLIIDNSISYTYKLADRSIFHTADKQKDGSDEILIIKNDFITDTSFSNIVLRNSQGLFTPDTPLLKGVKRELLLRNNIIKECPIRIDSLKDFTHIHLINAMIDFEDNVALPVSNIIR